MSIQHVANSVSSSQWLLPSFTSQKPYFAVTIGLPHISLVEDTQAQAATIYTTGFSLALQPPSLNANMAGISKAGLIQ